MNKERKNYPHIGYLIPYLIFLFLAFSFFSRFILWGYHQIAGDFTDWYQPWRTALVGKVNRNTYISNRTLGDPLFMFAPLDKQYNEQLKEGKWLLWSDRNFMGHPAYASHTSAFFYPPKIIANYWLDFLSARDALGVFHLFLMAVFMYHFLLSSGISRLASTLGGILWMLNGFVTTRVEFGTDIYPLVWLPFLLWMIDLHLKKKNLLYPALFALGTGMCILSGHWQFVFYCFLMAAVYGLYKIIKAGKEQGKFPLKETGFLLLAALAGFGLSAVQAIPALELIKIASRPGSQNMGQLFSISRLLPENLLTLVVPELFGNPVHHFYLTRIKSGVQNYFELMIYLGVLPLFLASVAPWSEKLKGLVKFFGITAVIVLLMALGTPLYALFFYLIPMAKGLTPVRILCLFAFCGSFLAAAGLDTFEEQKEKLKKAPWVFLGVLAAALIVLGYVIFQVENDTPAFMRTLEFYWKRGVMELPHNFADRRAFVGDMIFRIKSHYRWLNLQLSAPLLLGLAGVGLLMLRVRERVSRNVFALAVLIIVLLDLFPIGWRFNPAFPDNAIYPPAGAVKFLKDNAGEKRVSGWLRYPHPDTLAAYGLSEVNGYFSLYPARVRELFLVMNGGSLPSPLLAVFEKGEFFNPGLAGLMNIGYFYNDPAGEPPPVPCREVYRKDLSIFENTADTSRVFPVYNYKIASPGEILKNMMSKDFNPVETVYLEESPPDGFAPSPADTRGEIKVKVTGSSPGEITLDVDSPGKCFLVMGETYYPGWKAFADGKPVPILQADFFARAILVPAGKYRLEMKFQPDSLKTGLNISPASAVIILAALAAGIWKRQEKPKEE